jgi:hypothetical protein
MAQKIDKSKIAHARAKPMHCNLPENPKLHLSALLSRRLAPIERQQFEN